MDCYDNRELSWLKFNERVLAEAADESVGLGERLLFASIYQTNLDEFFMIRVGTLFDKMLIDPKFKDNKTELTAAGQLKAIRQRVKELCKVRDACYSNIFLSLQGIGVEQVHTSNLTGSDEEYLRAYFNSEVRPLISPQVVDKHHPFPFMKNKALYAVAQLEVKNSSKLGLVPIGGGFPRMIILPDKEKLRFVLIEDIILHYMNTIFENYRIPSKAIARITRNADIDMEEGLYDHDIDLREVMEELLKKRRKLSPVRLEVQGEVTEDALKKFLRLIDLGAENVFFQKSPLDLSFVFSLRNRIEEAHPEVFYKPFNPQRSASIVQNAPLIPQILRKDIMLFYPYESIRPFISLLSEAANDPEVVSIKITLYRVARNSKIIESLINAAENGKDVFVLVELRARFDEENNIGWSRELERAGCKVMYGPESLKVHSKLLLITRKNGTKLQYITQVGTGNYNEKTSELYTDLSLMTADANIGAEAGTFFNALSIGNLLENTSYLMVAPKALLNRIIEYIDTEIAQAMSGNGGYLGFKLNSLTDKILIDKLIEASCAGVKIEMVIRGINCLIPGVKGKTENITVRSIVGRFLEHSRIYIFGKGERQKVYISSADFMTRNTVRRVEVAAPINSPDIKNSILDIFDVMMKDNCRAWIEQPDGTYSRISPAEGEAPFAAQDRFIEMAREKASAIAVKKPIPVKVRRVKRRTERK